MTWQHARYNKKKSLSFFLSPFFYYYYYYSLLKCMWLSYLRHCTGPQLKKDYFMDHLDSGRGGSKLHWNIWHATIYHSLSKHKTFMRQLSEVLYCEYKSMFQLVVFWLYISCGKCMFPHFRGKYCLHLHGYLIRVVWILKWLGRNEWFMWESCRKCDQSEIWVGGGLFLQGILYVLGLQELM